MKIEDLKVGMYVRLRNGDKSEVRDVYGDAFIVDSSRCINTFWYNQDLTYVGNNDLDIIAVYSNDNDLIWES